MAETEAETARQYECGNCEDTHKVRVQFTGAQGLFYREVACPACGPDVTVTTPESRNVPDLREYDKRLTLVAALAVIAACLAAFAYMTAKDSNPLTEAVREVAE